MQFTIYIYRAIFVIRCTQICERGDAEKKEPFPEPSETQVTRSTEWQVKSRNLRLYQGPRIAPRVLTTCIRIRNRYTRVDRLAIDRIRVIPPRGKHTRDRHRIIDCIFHVLFLARISPRSDRL